MNFNNSSMGIIILLIPLGLLLFIASSYIWGVAFSYLIENVLMNREVDIWAMTSIWKGMALLILTGLAKLIQNGKGD